MFTGLVEEAGTVAEFRKVPTGVEFSILSRVCAKGLKTGGSLAVNGCCLTLTRKRRGSKGDLLVFNLLEETLRVTNLGQLAEGSLVNLERPLRVGAELGGHFVTGHVDGLGKVLKGQPKGADYYLEIKAPKTVAPYLLPKGSICIDGISLTVADVKKDVFSVWIIPHTYKVTNLRQRRAGDLVNLEADLLGKYVAKFIGR